MPAVSAHADPVPKPARHIRACVIGDQAVILDLKTNRYLGLASKQWRDATA